MNSDEEPDIAELVPDNYNSFVRNTRNNQQRRDPFENLTTAEKIAYILTHMDGNLAIILASSAIGVLSVFFFSVALKPAIGHTAIRYTLGWDCPDYYFKHAFIAHAAGDLLIHNRYTNRILANIYLDRHYVNDSPTIRIMRETFLHGASAAIGATTLGFAKSHEQIAFAAAIGISGCLISSNRKAAILFGFSSVASMAVGTLSSLVQNKPEISTSNSNEITVLINNINQTLTPRYITM